MRPRVPVILLTIAAAAGLFFASYSSYDFMQHLDRQVHGIHCSFIPGLDSTDASGSSGCHVTMMSPYSSVLRQTVWGGIPISLGAMGVFGYLLFRGLDVIFNRREADKGLAGYLALAWGLPFATSLVMGYLSLVELDAACKLCIGIYTASTVGFGSALAFWRSAGPDPDAEEQETETGEGFGVSQAIPSFLQGVAFVAIPVVLYVNAVPDYSTYEGACGTLPKPEDPYGVMIALDQNPGGKEAIEVLDPLCPSCRAFEHRLDASGLGEKMNRKAVLFPLDSSCNWMVGSTLHAGACTISEAVLCADARAGEVIDWAFENQEAIRAASEADPTAATKMVTDRFPDLKSCVGSTKVRSRLNKSLRWAVSNQLTVLTPQVYVEGTKLCDEDTDLGMDYALSRLLDGTPPAAQKGGL